MEKILYKNTYGFRNFISSEEQTELIDFVNKNLSLIRRRNQITQYETIQNIPNYPKTLIDNLRDRIVKLDEIGKHYPDIMQEDIIRVVFKNDYKLYHNDVGYGEWMVTRYNIVLKSAKSGGVFLYGDELNSFEEKMAWKCVSGIVRNGITKVESDSPLIVLSLGFMIKVSELNMKTDFSKISQYVKTMPLELEYLNTHIFKWNYIPPNLYQEKYS